MDTTTTELPPFLDQWLTSIPPEVGATLVVLVACVGVITAVYCTYQLAKKPIIIWEDKNEERP